MVAAFITPTTADFYDVNTNGEIVSMLIVFLWDGYNSIPKIKKVASENLKAIKDKLSKENSTISFEAVLKFTFKSEANEEAKMEGPESPSACDYD